MCVCVKKALCLCYCSPFVVKRLSRVSVDLDVYFCKLTLIVFLDYVGLLFVS